MDVEGELKWDKLMSIKKSTPSNFYDDLNPKVSAPVHFEGGLLDTGHGGCM